MCYRIKKTVFDFQEYKNFLVLKKCENMLIVKGFFGVISLTIPKNIILRVNKTKVIFFYIKSKDSLKKIKHFYHIIIFSLIGVLFNNFINISIKGIGFKFLFDKEKNNFFVHSGNSLPSVFNLPLNIRLLTNSSMNNFTILSSDIVLLHNFVNTVRKISIPNKYKEIGIFLEKK